MNKQILFCVETTKQANTDYQYIRETILHFYTENKKNIYRPIYMESKSRYNSNTVLKEIRRKQKVFKGETHVIYFIDTDDYDISPEANQELDQIRSFCAKNSYDFVFFCKDVEDVYYGRRIPATSKVQTVEQFKRRHSIRTINAIQLQSEKYKHHYSNIMTILDKYWTRIPD